MQHVPEEFVGPNSARDRRARVRHSPATLTYVKLGAGNGGVILDVSESGMAIASAEPLTELPLPALSFRLPRLDHTFVTSAELVWNSNAKQSAGVRFGSLSDQDRLQIKNWIKAELYAEAFPTTDRRTPTDRKQPAVSAVPRPRILSRASNRAADSSEPSSSPAAMPRIPAGFPAGLHGGPAPELSAEKAAEFERLFPSENPVEIQAAKAARAEREKARAAAPQSESPEYSMQFPSEHPEIVAANGNAATGIEDPLPVRAEIEPPASTKTIAEQSTSAELFETSENEVSTSIAKEVPTAKTELLGTTDDCAPVRSQPSEIASLDAVAANEPARAAAIAEDASATSFGTHAAKIETAGELSAEPPISAAEEIVAAESSAKEGLVTSAAENHTALAAETASGPAQASDATALSPFIDVAEFAAPPADSANNSAVIEPAIEAYDEPDESDVPVHDLNPVAEIEILPPVIEAKRGPIETPAPMVEQAVAKTEESVLDFPNLADLPEPLREPGRFSGGAVSDASVESLLAIAAAEESSEKSFRALRSAAPRMATPLQPSTASTTKSAAATGAVSSAPRHVSLRSPSQQMIPADDLESGDRNFRGLVVAASFVLIALCFAVGYSSGVHWLGFPWFAGGHASANDSATPTAASNTGATADAARQASNTGSISSPAYAGNPAPTDILIAPKRAAASVDGLTKPNSSAAAAGDAVHLPDSTAVAPDPNFSAPPLPASSSSPASFFPVTAPAEGSAARMVELPDQTVFDSPKVLIRLRQYFFVLPEPGPEWKHKLEHLTIGDPAAKISPPPAPGNSTNVVRIRATIGKDGTVTNVRPLSGSTTLIPQSLEAIRQWRYQPTLIDGKPMEWQGDFTIEYRPAP